MFINLKESIQSTYPDADFTNLSWETPGDVLFALVKLSLSTPILWEFNKKCENVLSYEQTLSLLVALSEKKLDPKDYDLQEELLWFITHCRLKSDNIFKYPRNYVPRRYIHNQNVSKNKKRTVSLEDGYFVASHLFYNNNFHVVIKGEEFDFSSYRIERLQKLLGSRISISGRIDYEKHCQSEGERLSLLKMLDRKDAQAWFPYFKRKEFTTILYNGDATWDMLGEIYTHLNDEQKAQCRRWVNKQFQYCLPAYSLEKFSEEQKVLFNEIVSLKNRCKMGFVALKERKIPIDKLLWLGKEFETSMTFWDLMPIKEEHLSMLDSFAKNVMVKSNVNYDIQECEIL